MVCKFVVLLIAAAFLLPPAGWAITEQEFKVDTTKELLDLCTAPPKDPLYREAVNFCQGYLVGAYAYYAAVNAGPSGDRLVCFPEPPPSRVEAIRMFIDWLKVHPEYYSEKPVDTEFRFLMEKWPCKK